MADQLAVYFSKIVVFFVEHSGCAQNESGIEQCRGKRYLYHKKYKHTKTVHHTGFAAEKVFHIRQAAVPAETRFRHKKHTVLITHNEQKKQHPCYGHQ